MKSFVLLFFISAAASAATFTFTDPNCADFSYAAGVLSCVTTTPPIPPDPPKPPATLQNCQNQGFTVIPYTGPVSIGWGLGVSANSGAFGNYQVWLFTLQVPPSAPQSSGIGRVDVVEAGGQPTIRQQTISETPCDFRPKDYTGVNGPLGVSQGVSVGLQYNTMPPQIFGGIAGLTPGRTYYISVRNYSTDQGAWSCPGDNCNALMNAQPQGASATVKKPMPQTKKK